MTQPTDLKAILHSKRANVYYLTKCRVLAKDGRVVYLTENQSNSHYWNIPIANTTVILLGIGTSITQAAVRLLSSAGVALGFCGSGGTPLISGTEIEWFTPQNEYRPTEYLQGWLSFWFDERMRLSVGKKFQIARICYLEEIWNKDRNLQNEGFYTDDPDTSRAFSGYKKNVELANNTQKLLQNEAELTKFLYGFAAKTTNFSGFKRDRNASDSHNSFLNHGNYLAYGLSASTLWVLGIPHGFAVLHGKTRRGALVFDVADLIKDALVLPWSFICAKNNSSEQEFRQQCLNVFQQHKAMDFMFNSVKKFAIEEA